MALYKTGQVTPVYTICLIVALNAHAFGQQDALVKSATVAPRRALLIGCTTYPNLIQMRQLRGPGNDVRLVRRLLLERFQFSSEDIKVLADAEGDENWPTRANIEREFRRLAQRTAPGDHVIILLAGHGSQQPNRDTDPDSDPETDGRDEVFLPRDTGRWAREDQSIRNAIVDDELRAWLSAIVTRGAFVFFVADSCHSGTVSRGDDSVSRQVPTSELGVPEIEGWPIGRHPSRRGPKNPSFSDWLDAANFTGGDSGLVALYAAQSHQEAVEERFEGDNRRYGRLSHTLCSVLQQCDEPISYRELTQRILWVFTQNGWIHRSTPGMEGTDLSRQVLGKRRWPGRSRLQLSRSEEGYSVSGGSLHGITRGSVLAVHSPAGAAGQQQMGYVRIIHAAPLSSDAKSFAFGGQKPADEFPVGARCELVYREMGEMKLTVDVQSESFAFAEIATAAEEQVRVVLAELAGGEDALMRMADADHSAAWVAVATPDGGIYLQRADSKLALNDPDGERRGEVLGPCPVPNMKRWLTDKVHNIARATNLRRLAEQESRFRDPSVDVQLTVARSDDRPFAPVNADAAVVRDDEQMQLTIRNVGRNAISVAVFYIQNDFAIMPFFPLSAKDHSNNVIENGGELYKAVKFNINDKTLGWEDVIVIAVDAADQMAITDILKLQQGGFASRSRHGKVTPGPLRSSLGRLIDDAMNGGTRGLDLPTAAVLGSYAIRRVSWNVVRE